jgi:hypothetical protein
MPHRHRLTAWSLLFASLLFGAVFFTSQPQAGDEDDVQQTVQSQLQALAAQDAGKAFDLTDPSLRTRFVSAQQFLDTVRDNYPMVLHPASVLYLKPESHGSTALQKVRITDERGSNWVLTWLLNRQGGGQWRISGCTVEPGGVQVIA